jgi:helix-turn-helix protein
MAAGMQPFRAANGGSIEVMPLLVVTQAFPARPSSLPVIRDFVRQRLSQSIFTEDDVRALGEQLLVALLDVAGPTGMIQVSVRIFPEYAEVDVLPATVVVEQLSTVGAAAPADAAEAGAVCVHGPNGSEREADGLAAISFAEWLAGALRRESMTMEAAARRLQVSVKTVSRWVGGTTEPRLRDLSRIREVFGELPFP